MKTPLPNTSFNLLYNGKMYFCKKIDKPGEFIVVDSPDDDFGEWIDCWEGLLGVVPYVPGKTLKEKVEYLQDNSEYKKTIFNNQMKDILDS